MESQWQEVLGAIDSVLEASFTIGGSEVTVADLFVVVAILVVAFLFSRIVRQGLDRIMRRRGVDDEGTIAITLRIVHYAVVVLGLLTAVGQVGINLSALFAAGAVFAVGIGFALQGLTVNFVSGVILLFERSIKPGDIVEVDGYVARVLKLGIRTTLCRNRDDEEILVPNSHLVDSTVKNFTLHDSTLRLRGSVGVAYESDVARVMEVLDTMADGLKWRLRDRTPVVLLTGFGSSSIDFEVSVWTSDPWQAPRYRSELLKGIWFALKDADITIAFPQLDVHFDAPINEAASGLPRAS
ncbi:mechanosensitive ion channel family protein [Gaopeijia maritima]|uniref:Mechanosensitive ion channel domain-containing protein n=1 Tax=Gaopeijia maritima TaxID=3119007 RepID=A0ABU9ECE2_9BACT